MLYFYIGFTNAYGYAMFILIMHSQQKYLAPQIQVNKPNVVLVRTSGRAAKGAFCYLLIIMYNHPNLDVCNRWYITSQRPRRLW
jgi:hypothetical protein